MRLAAEYPDLFTAGFGVVAPSDESIFGGATGGYFRDNPVLEAVDRRSGVPSWAKFTDRELVLGALKNLRHIPVLLWYG